MKKVISLISLLTLFSCSRKSYPLDIDDYDYFIGKSLESLTPVKHCYAYGGIMFIEVEEEGKLVEIKTLNTEGLCVKKEKN